MRAAIAALRRRSGQDWQATGSAEHHLAFALNLLGRHAEAASYARQEIQTGIRSGWEYSATPTLH
jgi:hypothetical protein